MKKLILDLGKGLGEILTREELRKVLGGSYYGSGENVCRGKSKETCSGACEVDGYTGYCVWVTIQNSCACAMTYGGS